MNKTTTKCKRPYNKPEFCMIEHLSLEESCLQGSNFGSVSNEALTKGEDYVIEWF